MLTFKSCKETVDSQLKRGLDKKKLANNTYLRKLDDNTYAITLHRTDVVTIFERNGQTVYRLNSGGYQTVTTKDRLNSFSPARIFQKRGVWYMQQHQVNESPAEVLYFDGIEVDVAGQVVNTEAAPTDTLAKKKKLDRMISFFIEEFCDDALRNGLGRPETGDCLICKMNSQQINALANDDLYHVYSHLEEKYLVRSFLLYCIKIHGYVNPGLIWVMLESECEKGSVAGLKRELRYGLNKMKDKLMQFVVAEEEPELALAS